MIRRRLRMNLRIGGVGPWCDDYEKETIEMGGSKENWVNGKIQKA